jgi:hypothetical protein
MEHYFETIGENWFSYQYFYRDMVSRFNNAKFAEIGCWKGRSTAYLGVEIINQNKNIELYCIDSWKYKETTEQPAGNQSEFDKVYEQFCNNIKPIKNIVNICRMDSVSASCQYPDNYFDFIFIDAGHTYVDVLQDLKAWYPKCKNVIAGHDYFTRVHPGVKQAVDEFFDYDIWCNPKLNIWVK